jgi:indolepyruvate ferredoxin oxidoreductase
MIDDYIKELDNICTALSPVNHAAAVALASVPDEVRGYGHVKEKSVAEAKALREQRAYAFRNPHPQPQPQPQPQTQPQPGVQSVAI